MSRFTFLFLLTPLLVLPGCEPEPEPDLQSESDTDSGSESESGSETESESESETTVEEDADAFIASLLEVAVYLCECSVEAEGVDPEPCAEAVEEEFGTAFGECILGAMSMYPSAREGLRCDTEVVRDYVACAGGEAACLDPTTDDDHPCTVAADAADEACEDLSPEADAAVDECFAIDETEDCSDDEC